MKKLILIFLFLLTTNALASEQVFIQVRFSENTEKGQYNDALYFTQEDYAKKTQKEIDTLKQERVNNWLAVVNNPIPTIEPSLKDLESEKLDLEQRINLLQEKINAKTNILNISD